MLFQSLLSHLGYAFVGLFYVNAGAIHFHRFKELREALAERHIPAPGTVLVVGSIFQILSGLMLALQSYVRLSALGLAVFTVAASVMLLDFWRMSGPTRRTAIGTWQTNLALTGALLVIGLY